MVLKSGTNSIPVKSKNLPLTHKSIVETTRKKRELQSLISKNSSLFFFACIFLLGIAVGALVGGFTRGTILEKLDFLFHASFLSRSADAYSAVFISSFASSFLFVLAFLLLALSVWGFLCTPLLLFFRGFGSGLTAGYLYISFGWKGFLYYFLTILPGASLCGIALLLAAKESARVSRSIGMQKKPDYTLLFNRFGVVLAMLFCSALLDMGMNFCFADFFLLYEYLLMHF